VNVVPSAPADVAPERATGRVGPSDHDLGAAGVTIAQVALKLVYEVGSVLGMAARDLVSATLDAADTVAPRRRALALPVAPGPLALRKPPGAVRVKAARRASRRLTG
jgi:hypothetical protein